MLFILKSTKQSLMFCYEKVKSKQQIAENAYYLVDPCFVTIFTVPTMSEPFHKYSVSISIFASGREIPSNERLSCYISGVGMGKSNGGMGNVES